MAYLKNKFVSADEAAALVQSEDTVCVLEPGRKESQQFQNVVPDIFGLEASELASLGAKRFHGKPPLIGLGAHRRSGGRRVQTLAIARFLFGRALRLLCNRNSPREETYVSSGKHG